jgi:hypothetical protein
MSVEMGMPDFFGVPQFFINRVVKCESAGHGNIRVYCASIRGAELVPEFSVVMSIEEIMVATAFVKQCAADLWNGEQLLISAMAN